MVLPLIKILFMQQTNVDSLYKALIKAISFAAGIVIFLWFLIKISGVLMLLLFAVTIAIVINGPVTLLEKRKITRGWASLIVFGIIFLVIALIGWLVIPTIGEQLTLLISNIPGYIQQLSKLIASSLSEYPDVAKQLETGGNNMADWIPSIPSTLMRVGNFSLNILGSVLIIIIFLSLIIYMVLQPRPLVEIYLSLFSAQNRDKATRALTKASVMLIGWMRANIIGGAIQAVAVTVVLSILKVPGAFVWGALAFFAQLIPKIGFYIMALPPILVALSINPTKAIWVTVFFLALDEILGDFVMPRIRSSTMNIHPASILIVLLAMAAAFGATGAILATPLAAIIKAYYEEFYLSRTKADPQIEERIDSILYRKDETNDVGKEMVKSKVESSDM
jgi:predicted PurR-regulated permease PerM